MTTNREAVEVQRLFERCEIMGEGKLLGGMVCLPTGDFRWLLQLARTPPSEPSEAMIEAGRNAALRHYRSAPISDEAYQEIYRAMVAALNQPEQER